MGYWGLKPSVARVMHDGTWVDMTTSSNANEKGSWYSLWTTTSNLNGLTISSYTTNGYYRYAFDLALDNAGDAIIAENLYFFQYNNAHGHGRKFYIPVNIPSGTTIYGRAAANTGSRKYYPLAEGYSGGKFGAKFGGCSKLVSGEFDATRTEPPFVLTSDTDLEWGEWIWAITDCPHDLKGYFVTLDQYNAWYIPQACYYYLQVGIGPSGSVVPISPKLSFASDVNADCYTGTQGPFWQPIPKGSKIAMRVMKWASGSTSSYITKMCPMFYGIV